MRSTVTVSRTRYTSRLSAAGALASGYTRKPVPPLRSLSVFQRAAVQQEPAIGSGHSDGWLRQHDQSCAALSGARLGTCLRHALTSSRRNWRLSIPVRKALARSSTPYCTGRDNAKACACCARPAVASLCRPRRPHGGDGQAARRRCFRRRKRVYTVLATRRCCASTLLDQRITLSTEAVRDEVPSSR